MSDLRVNFPQAFQQIRLPVKVVSLLPLLHQAMYLPKARALLIRARCMQIHLYQRSYSFLLQRSAIFIPLEQLGLISSSPECLLVDHFAEVGTELLLI